MEMEWVNIIISGACAILGALGGSVVTSLIFYKPTKRTKDAEADKAESAVEDDEVKRWKDIADQLQDQQTLLNSHIDAKNKHIDKLYDVQHALEDRLRVMTSNYNSTLLFVDYIKHNYCIRRPCGLGRIPEDVPSIDDIEKELEKKGLILHGSTTEQNDPPNAG